MDGWLEVSERLMRKKTGYVLMDLAVRKFCFLLKVCMAPLFSFSFFLSVRLFLETKNFVFVNIFTQLIILDY